MKKLERYTINWGDDENLNAKWCRSKDVEKLEEENNQLLNALQHIRNITNINPGVMIPVGEIWKITNDILMKGEQ